MAVTQVKPLFITGANAKIKGNGKVLAYATDVQAVVDVAHVAVEVMGRYEVVANEPVAYATSGSLTIVRYTAASNAEGLEQSAVGGNASQNWATDHFNPQNLLASRTFEIEVFQKYSQGTATAISTEKVLKISKCRLTRRLGGLSKRSIYGEQYLFDGIIHITSDAEGPGTPDVDLS